MLSENMSVFPLFFCFGVFVFLVVLLVSTNLNNYVCVILLTYVCE